MHYSPPRQGVECFCEFSQKHPTSYLKFEFFFFFTVQTMIDAANPIEWDTDSSLI